jgi:hypothetical protein
MTFMERWRAYLKKSDEESRKRHVEIAKDIERTLIRMFRNDPKKLAEILDARAERERIWGK